MKLSDFGIKKTQNHYLANYYQTVAHLNTLHSSSSIITSLMIAYYKTQLAMTSKDWDKVICPQQEKN